MRVGIGSLASQAVGGRYKALDTWHAFNTGIQKQRTQDAEMRTSAVRNQEPRQIPAYTTKSPAPNYKLFVEGDIVPFGIGFLRELNASTPAGGASRNNFENVSPSGVVISPAERMKTEDREGVMALALATGNPLLARKLIEGSLESSLNYVLAA